ncbi:adenylate/guanylate cyclase domain-containing protein [Leptospira gomenensis]|uniref:Adenylate/guanylate cyclase domain-containing protein n=1 Tax=Leptospira gomenensis TaxID=2484974 RepID=A0A5F1Y7J4_9LEPT|nr:adenylate/guanylate cyclase domain-containing protein [Leptospira gomenensis]TGK29513.1 adenylate/guanylate cyclase domain-containing protein [Leptospira gomenensis]TGK33911.1 adenylate/guanylate cyclase domain-containing protein [Leptospira gomenensis]TGK44825.1 adenylate/guanylate cyclase domain-containing protein [Leptospira gomenensis]TGK64444.1 adenylate/guanylate cyclase domain-containing protein [Leptospira gomenensis]
MWNETLLAQKKKALEGFSVLSRESISRFIQSLQKQTEWELHRMNPLRFAKKNGITTDETLDLFLHSGKIGLLDFSYNMICPACGGIAASHTSLDQIEEKSFHCSICNLDVPTTLDDQVEVSFSVHPSLKKSDLQPLADVPTYLNYHISHNFHKSKELLEFIFGNTKGLIVLEPGSTQTIRLDARNVPAYQLSSVENNSAVHLRFDAEVPTSDRIIDLSLLPSGFTPTELHLSPGEYELKVSNRTIAKSGFLLFVPNIERILEIIKEHPTVVEPFLTAKMLLNNQTFRELFRVQQLSNRLNLNVKSLTILFTDLRGSTEMYDKAGDMLAYRLVQEHFRLLAETVKKFSGAIVKTMGDAIMATFSSPSDGMMAALEMMTRIDQMNEEFKEHGHEIGLKVGLNEGPALAVINDERLDYFGQSVNIAARVQALASAGEIWVTEPILSSPGILDQLSQRGYGSEKHEASLKGVGRTATVHKLFKNEETAKLAGVF